MIIKGLHIFCQKKGCHKVVSSKDAICKATGKLAKNCPFKDKHKYQSRIWNPHTKKTNKIKTWDTTNKKEVLQLHINFQEIVRNQEAPIIQKKVFPTILRDCMAMYLDWMQDVDLPEQEKKNLSNDYIVAVKKKLVKFTTVVGKTIRINIIDNHHVGKFHKSLEDYAPKTYNHHIQALRSFFDWLIKYGYDIENPFREVRAKYVVKSPQIILEEQIEKLLSVITYENGWHYYEYKGKTMRRNWYRPWLKHAFGLFLLTGERRDGVFHLKWDDINGDYLKIPNYKVNLAKKVEIHSDVFISDDIAELLLSLPSKDGYLIAPENENRNTVKDVCSKAFTHFWKVAGFEEERELSDLRKSYLTRMRILLGDLADVLGKNKRDTEVEYYLSQKEIQKQFKGKRIFEIKF